MLTPEQLWTAKILALILISSWGIACVGLLWLEWKTLSDSHRDNHITAVVKRLLQEESARGPIFGLLFAIVGMTAFIFGHLFW